MVKGTGVTIIDIANRAGVSFKTVSRVLNRNPRVAEELRWRVEAAMQDLNYQPNRAARSLKGSRNFAIGLLLGTQATSPLAERFYSSPYVVELQRGMLCACRNADYTLVVDWMDLRSKTLAADFRRHLLRMPVDGILLAPPLGDYRLALNTFESVGMAYARIAPGIDSTRSLAVGIDDRAAAFAMTRYLQSLGHRRIGFVSGPSGHIAASARLIGYQEALACEDESEPIVVSGSFTFESGMDAGADLLRHDPAPTAIFAANDDMAAGVMAAAGVAGLRIPNDLSVAGFDNSTAAHYVWPSLTTVHQPIAEMSACATEHLINAAAERLPLEPLQIQLAFEIIERRSTAAPPR